LMGGLLHLVQRGGDWAGGCSPPTPLLAVPNVTAHPSTASVPTRIIRCGTIIAGKETPACPPYSNSESMLGITTTSRRSVTIILNRCRRFITRPQVSANGYCFAQRHDVGLSVCLDYG